MGEMRLDPRAATNSDSFKRAFEDLHAIYSRRMIEVVGSKERATWCQLFEHRNWFPQPTNSRRFFYSEKVFESVNGQFVQNWD